MPVNIIIDSKFDDKGIRKAQADLQQMAGNAAKRVAQVGAAVAAAGAVAAGKLAVDAVQAASSFEESINAVNVSFGDAADGVLALGENAAQAMGVSREEFNSAAVRFSAFAERVVGSGGDVTEFIGDISQRAADFASVFNIEVSEALQVFQSGLAGEAEPLKRFGINLLQSEVAAFAMANGIAESSSSMTEAQKVQARYGLLMQATNKTAGDFANTSGSLANTQRRLTAEMSNLQVEIGAALLPVAKDLVTTFADNLMPRLEEFGEFLNSPEGVEAVKDFGSQIENVVNFLLDFAGFIAENLGTIIGLGIAIAGVTTAVKLYSIAVQIATVRQAALNATIALNPLGALAVAIAAVTTALGFGAAALLNYNSSSQESNEVNEKFKDSLLQMQDEIEELNDLLAEGKITQEQYNLGVSELEKRMRDTRGAQQDYYNFTEEQKAASFRARDAAIAQRFAVRDLANEKNDSLPATENLTIAENVYGEKLLLNNDLLITNAALTEAKRRHEEALAAGGPAYTGTLQEMVETVMRQNAALDAGLSRYSDQIELVETATGAMKFVATATGNAAVVNEYAAGTTEALGMSYDGLTKQIDEATEAQKRFANATPGNAFEGRFFEAVNPDGTTGVFNIEGEEFFGLSVGGKEVGRQEPPDVTPESTSLTPEKMSFNPPTSGTSTTVGGGNTNINVNVSANNPLDAQEAGKNVVSALGRFQSTNGDISVPLTGVGN